MQTELLRGTSEVIPADDFSDLIKSGKKLRVKAGFDPTSSDLHLGHTVLFNKLRQFQDCGHQVIFLIGDFTACIGDPSGKNITRPSLTAAEVAANADTYIAQAGKILDLEKVEIRYNSEWLDKLDARALLELCMSQTVARLLERDDFTKRFQAQTPIALHELLYPVLQGYDSVALQADVELGGTDQKFNLIMGRNLQRQAGQDPQIVMTLPLLEGTDGVNKMSKSLDNYIGISEDATTIFGKVMSIPDTIMWRYYELLSSKSIAAITQLQEDTKAGANPRDAKFELASELTERFHGDGAGVAARQDFIDRFSNKQLPDDIPEHNLEIGEQDPVIGPVLKQIGLVSSSSEAVRLIKQNAVSVDGAKISDPYLVLPRGTQVLIKVGKLRLAYVTIA